MRLMFLFLAIPFFVLLSGCERAKTEFDREVDRLCAIDGGVHVYETVELPSEYFLSDGRLDPKFSQSLMRGRNHLYRTEFSSEIIEQRRQIPFFRTRVVLKRSGSSVIRVSDNKVLAERIVYARGGGDFFGPWADSAYSCFDILPLQGAIDSEVFHKEESL